MQGSRSTQEVFDACKIRPPSLSKGNEKKHHHTRLSAQNWNHFRFYVKAAKAQEVSRFCHMLWASLSSQTLHLWQAQTVEKNTRLLSSYNRPSGPNHRPHCTMWGQHACRAGCKVDQSIVELTRGLSISALFHSPAENFRRNTQCVRALSKSFECSAVWCVAPFATLICAWWRLVLQLVDQARCSAVAWQTLRLRCVSGWSVELFDGTGRAWLYYEKFDGAKQGTKTRCGRLLSRKSFSDALLIKFHRLADD